MTYNPADPQSDAQWRPRPAPEQYPQPGQYPAPDAQVQPAQQWQAQPWQGQPAGAYQQPMVSPRSAALGVLLSFFIPGLGSMVNGRVGIGVLILCLYVLGLILSFFLIGIPICFGVWIWGMVDGYKAAQEWNRAHGIIS